MVNDHRGWETFPPTFLAVAWGVAFIGFHVTHRDKATTVPHWLSSLQGTFCFSMGVTKGFVIIAQRLSPSWPDFFPLIYAGLLVAFFAPLWIWKPTKDEVLTWRTALIGILYLVLLTYVTALKVKYAPDSSMTTHYWIIPVGIISGLLLIAWFLKKDYRKDIIIGGGLLAGIVGWLATISWVSTWIT